MKANHDVGGLLASLAEAQTTAAALGLDFVAFLIGMAILATCDTVEPENDHAVDARAGSAAR